MIKHKIITLFLVFSLITTTQIHTANAADVLKLNRHLVSLEHGQSFQLRTKNSSGKVRYTTNRPDIIKLSNTGFVVGLKPGIAIVTASKGRLKATCKFRVVKPTILLNKKKLSLSPGKSRLIRAFVSSGYHPVWKSNRKKVATVNDLGRVYAKRKGKAVITASFDGVTKKCNVTVR